MAEVERRAFRMVEMATGNADDALDILQDAMYKLAQKYSRRDPSEWGPLFHTILQSRIKDYYRRNSLHNRFRVWLGGKEDMEADPVQALADVDGILPEDGVDAGRSMQRIGAAVRRLPLRQQQAFMLRALEGLDVAETARVMKCSEGSVKTHYSRAVHTLREQLQDYRP